MTRKRMGLAAIVRSRLTPRRLPGWLGRRGRGWLGLAVVGAVGIAGRGLAQDVQHPIEHRTAQDPEEWYYTGTYHMTVRPRAMATGTRTERAGEFRLGPEHKDVVYVPRSCVGTRRCPLILYVHGLAPQWLTPVADKYGMIVLFPYRDYSVVLTEILQTFAIDPAKIAIVGRCATGSVPMEWGDHNPDVFSRMATFTANAGDPPPKTPDRPSEYFLSQSLGEGQNFSGVQRLRARGYAVKHVANFREHEHQTEDYDFMGQWLQESWAIPNPADRPVPPDAPPAPELTTEALAKMTAFWTRFMHEPEGIRITARRRHVRELVVPVAATEHISLLMVDMAALAAEQRAVAADLEAAGLTAEQHDAYRAAWASAFLTLRDTYEDLSPAPAGSVLAKNVAFLEAHPDESQALEDTGMRTAP